MNINWHDADMNAVFLLPERAVLIQAIDGCIQVISLKRGTYVPDPSGKYDNLIEWPEEDRILKCSTRMTLLAFEEWYGRQKLGHGGDQIRSALFAAARGDDRFVMTTPDIAPLVRLVDAIEAMAKKNNREVAA